MTISGRKNPMIGGDWGDGGERREARGNDCRGRKFSAPTIIAIQTKFSALMIGRGGSNYFAACRVFTNFPSDHSSILSMLPFSR